MSETAIHSSPAWQSKANFLIRADLGNYGMPGRIEQLWVRKLSDNTFQLCCIPFFTYGVALGDIVETDDNLFFRRVASKEGHKILRGAVINKEKVVELHELIHNYLEQLALSNEWYAPGYFAVDLPSINQDEELFIFMQKLADTGDLSYEIDD